MKLTRLKWILFLVPFLISVTTSSCSSRSGLSVCKGNMPNRGYNAKKNKSRYSQKYNYKTRSVRKDYVIKNGIAH